VACPGGGPIRPAFTVSSMGCVRQVRPAVVLGKAQVESVALEIPGGGRLDEAAQAQALQQHFLPAFKGKRVTVLAEKGLTKLLPVRKS
jgi:hypothetical protein